MGSNSWQLTIKQKSAMFKVTLLLALVAFATFSSSFAQPSTIKKSDGNTESSDCVGCVAALSPFIVSGAASFEAWFEVWQCVSSSLVMSDTCYHCVCPVINEKFCDNCLNCN